MPQAVLDQLAAEFDQALSGIEEALDEFPILLPIPHLGASIELSLPFVVIDGLRFSGGMLNDVMLRGVGSLFGLDIPQPLVNVEIEEDGFEASFTGDLSFSSFILFTSQQFEGSYHAEHEPYASKYREKISDRQVFSAI